MKKNQLLIVILLLAVAIAIAIAMRGMVTTPQHKESHRQLPSVEYATVKSGPVTFNIESHGTVTSRQAGPVSSEVSGRITSLAGGFRPGRFVRKDEPLLTVDTTDYELAVANARTWLYDRQLQLEDKKSRYASDSLSMKQADAAYQAAVATLKKAESDLAKTTVLAPYNGVITRKNAEIGQFIARGAIIAELSGSDVAEIRLPVNPADILFITPGLYTGKLNTPIMLTRSIGGKVESRTIRDARVEGQLDEATRVFYITANIDKPYSEPVFPAGIFATASIEALPVSNAVELPQQVVHNGNSVYLLVDGRLKQQAIDIAYRKGSSVIITGGLQDGDKVVLTRMDLMFDGMQVNARASAP